jgi:hypothetical protein
MGEKVKEIKDNAIIEIKINKVFYLMLKKTLMYIFKQELDNEKITELIKKVTDKNSDNEPHTEQEFAFKTVFLLLAEIEAQADKTNQFEEKDIDDVLKSSVKQD